MKANLIIEITNRSLKIVAYRDVLKSQKIIKVLVEPIPPEASSESKAKILKDLLRRLNLKPQSIGFCLPRNQLIVRNFRFPSADAKEIDNILSLRIEEEVPYHKEETISGYQILNEEKDGYTEVLSAIAQREVIIEELFNISERVNLYPERIELSSCGVLHWFLSSQLSDKVDPREFYLLLDIDQEWTDFIIFQGDRVIFTHSIAHKAEVLEEKEGEKEFADKIKQALVIFQAKEPQKKPVKIFLSGAKLVSEQSGNSLTPQLANFLEKELNLPVEVVSPPSSVSAFLANIPQEISVSGVCGLAISRKRNIFFVLPEMETRHLLKTRVRELTLLGSFLLYFLVVVSGILGVKVYKKESYLRELNKHYQQIAPEIEDLTEIQSRMRIIEERLDMRRSALNCLAEIHRVIPAEITLRSIDFRRSKRVILRGYGRAMSDIFNFVNVLEGTPCFKNVETKYTSKKKLKGEEVSEFEIVCPISLMPLIEH